MGRREFVALLGGAATAWPVAAHAQQGVKVYRIGFLSAGVAPKYWSNFVSGLRELGWIEGKNIVFELRHAENRLDSVWCRSCAMMGML